MIYDAAVATAVSCTQGVYHTLVITHTHTHKHTDLHRACADCLLILYANIGHISAQMLVQCNINFSRSLCQRNDKYDFYFVSENAMSE